MAPSARMLMATPETMWSTPKVTVAIACSRPPSAPPMTPTRSRPRGPTGSRPSRAEPGAEDHHAFEADVDDAGPLGPQAAEAGQADRHGERRARRPSAPAEVMSSAPVMRRTTETRTRQRRRSAGHRATSHPAPAPAGAGSRCAASAAVGLRSAHAGTSCFVGRRRRVAGRVRADLALLACAGRSAGRPRRRRRPTETITPCMIADDLLVVCPRSPAGARRGPGSPTAARAKAMPTGRCGRAGRWRCR